MFYLLCFYLSFFLLHYNLKLSSKFLFIFCCELIFSAPNEQISLLRDCTKKSGRETDFTILFGSICLLYKRNFLRLKHANALRMLAMFD